MSDNDDDAEFEASLANLEVSGLEGGGDLLPGTGDPEIASRIDSLHSTVSTLGMRLDSLVTSTTTYRSSLTDRLTEYAELVTKLTRTQSNDLEEYRRANERTISELRRSLTTSQEVLERVGGRLDAMLTDAESTEDGSRRMLAEVRSILEAQESLGRFITESLDQFADRVATRLDTTQEASVSQLDALRVTLDDLAGRDLTRGVRDDLAELRSIVVEMRSEGSGDQLQGLQSTIDSLLGTADADSARLANVVDELRETLLDVASGEVVGALWDEVRGIRDLLDESQIATAGAPGVEPASAAALDAVRAEITAVRQTLDDALIPVDEELDAVTEGGPSASPAMIDALHRDVADLATAVRELLDQAEVVDDTEAPPPDAGMLTAVAADVAHLREELSRGLVVEPSDALAGAVDDLRVDLTELRDRLGVLADLETAISELRPAEPDDDWADAPISDTATEDAKGAEDAERESVVAARFHELAAEMATVRSGVVDILSRLDEGLVLAEDDGPVSPTPAASAATADQLAALRDQVATEFEALRAAIDRDTDAPPPATIDPDTIDLLREEIRGAGGSDEVFESLAKELKALRRRIRLRAEGEVFSAADLDVIAAAVAERLAD